MIGAADFGRRGLYLPLVQITTFWERGVWDWELRRLVISPLCKYKSVKLLILSHNVLCLQGYQPLSFNTPSVRFNSFPLCFQPFLQPLWNQFVVERPTRRLFKVVVERVEVGIWDIWSSHKLWHLFLTQLL